MIIKNLKLRIGGMTCNACQNRIEKVLCSTSGVQNANVSYSTEKAVVAYDAETLSPENIAAAIEKLGYKVLENEAKQMPQAIRIAGIFIIIIALYMVLQYFGILNMLVPKELASAEMAYGVLFLIGLTTSVHCLAMCGGINLSVCISRGGAHLYSLGRVISYTVIGFIAGAIGSVIDFSHAMQGTLKLIAGVFMVIMGINLLGFFPWMRKLNLRMPKFIAKRVNAEKSKSKSPLIIGLLNGFMPCGPLQAMQIYALSTGNALTGALSMFLFCLGTVPLTFGFGAFSSMLGQKFTRKATIAGATLVVVLGMSMFTDGWSLSSFTDSKPPPSEIGVMHRSEENTQVINSTLSPYQYADITVKVGIPVKWIYDIPPGSLNGCNNRIIIREYGIEYAFKPLSQNIIEFTPTRTGKFQYTCWMGMIRATITVVDS
jgi:sulfite exporter TauE/SafE